MRTRIGFWAVAGLLTMLAPAAVEAQYQQAPPPRGPAVEPTYPAASPEALVPRDPTLLRRTPEQMPGAPFTLTPQQQAEVDWLLARWEQHGAGVKTFECGFTRFEYDGVFDSGDKPSFIDKGEIRYAAPDKGLFRVDEQIVDYQWINNQAVGGRSVKGQRLEHWISNGTSIFQYDFQNRQLIEHKLPPELHGKAISESPLPFFFGAKADHLRKRYFLRLVTPEGADDQVWLEAHPRFQADAANFRQATLILTLSTMQPSALQIILPNGKSRTVYQFHSPRMNVKNLLDPLGVFENNWLHPRVPPGWKKVVEEAPQA